MTTTVRQANPSDAGTLARLIEQEHGGPIAEVDEFFIARAFYIAHGYAPRSGCELWDKPLSWG